MEKQKITKFGDDYYLLGINQENEKVWLEKPSWDCDWYWGFGYVEIFNQNYSVPLCHKRDKKQKG